MSHVHLRWINPFPSDLKSILSKFKHVLIPEINMGQLIKLIRSEFLVDAKGLNLVRGKPIGAPVITEKVKEIIDKDEVKISDDNDFVDVLVAIEEEMAAVRELYVG